LQSNGSRVWAVMPHFQQAEYILAAWESVRGEVGRLCVVDDGSETPCVLADIFLPQNMGTAFAINTGIQTLLHQPAPADWLTWVSSDNIYRPGWVKALLDATDGDTGAVYGGFTWAKGRDERYLFVPHTPDRLINQEECYYGPVFLIRREVWKEAGPHRGKISHDYDHWLRVEEACWKMGKKIVGVDRDLCWYRAHDKRATVLRRDQYDAKHWQAEGKKRRGIA
jgi:glycosyltransferase involved in cell wall biosynthesis